MNIKTKDWLCQNWLLLAWVYPICVYLILLCFCLFECIEAYGQNCNCEAIVSRKLLLQMDNCVKDNKNRHMLEFLSLLLAKKVFEEVQLELLVVGHTHEDIDKSFSYLSKKLKE